MNEDLIQVAVTIAPEVIALLKSAFQKQHPDALVPTEPEIIAAYQVAFTSSLAKDDFWLTTHRAP